ncbi:hypothetical protein SeMB42_g04637 [Synchytrium endobioticum]|uniref:dynamin GTPase n=1 Tax=Synchytrium endobioticum TaxID=286115 RepID=A0A507CWT7_9FUNG|nr:hypothetical protein SeMB42_g04637 [Synchytrium endobioticum]
MSAWPASARGRVRSRDVASEHIEAKAKEILCVGRSIRLTLDSPLSSILSQHPVVSLQSQCLLSSSRTMLRIGRIPSTRYVWQPTNRPQPAGKSLQWNHSTHRTLVGARTTFHLVRGVAALGASVAGAAGAAWYSVQSWSKGQADWANKKWDAFKDWADHIELPFSQRRHSEVHDTKLPPHDNSTDPNPASTAAVVVATSTGLLSQYSEEEEEEKSRETSAPAPVVANQMSQQPSTPSTRDAELMVLTRKLIEIRSLLKQLQSGNLAPRLPSIVVIGSQSSGKSSVLEAIVGHSFLPKGSNMVTRRPIELTLINTPDSREEYAVSDAECVSSNPIELRVYSPNVPDLTLIDLPGFIQIHNRKQPPVLKEKIAQLCEAYIQEPNIILAVCAADVDLANSEALRASRKVDPGGRRTVGVITKLDLVDPDAGSRLLSHNDYPLSLGYVGVVCKPIMASNPLFSSALAHQTSPLTALDSSAMMRHEREYFASHPEYQAANASTGILKLRQRLKQVLERHMSKSVHAIVDSVQAELDEVRYQFKVQYNDLRITPESYVAETVDGLKQRFKEFTKSFGKQQVRDEVRSMLQARIMDICADMYWTDPRFPMFPRTCNSSEDRTWENKVDTASAALTKSGIGRASVQLVYDRIMDAMGQVTSADPFMHHPDARAQIMVRAQSLLKSRMHVAADSVENTIKPLKFEVEATPQEWNDGVKRAINMVDDALVDAQRQLRDIQSSVGRRRLRLAVRQLQRQEVKTGQPLVDAAYHSPDNASDSDVSVLTEQAKAAFSLHRRMALLKSRSAALKSSLCSTENRSCCPEIILAVIAEKLVSSAVSFISVELLTEFFFDLPRTVDDSLYYGLSKEDMTAFAKENPSVRKHLELMQRRRVLEEVMDKLRDLGERDSRRR